MSELMRCLEDVELDFDRNELVAKFQADLQKLDTRVLGTGITSSSAIQSAALAAAGERTEFNAADEMDRMRLVFTQKLAAATVAS
jgi:hypothetical protein